MDATRKRHRVADPLRERILRLEELGYQETNPMLIQTLEACADRIDREHERRMEQSRHETKRAFAKYIRQITEEYERSHKRKSWLRQQEMQLELDVLRYKEGKAGK